MKRRTHLLIIDPQNDFCDLPESYRPLEPSGGARMAPALPVGGAHVDMLRLADFIKRGSSGVTDITVTLDSHHRLDIAHPTFWNTRAGGPVSAFTPISLAQVEAGDYRPRDPLAWPRARAYLRELETRGRYTLMVWPVHCEIGTWGHNVHADVRLAYNAWEERQLGVVQKVIKGTNPWTEHYSALLAEVPDADDPATQLNRALIDQLDRSELLIIAGEASSHCVKATTEHIVQNLPSQKLDRIVLLTDCMSPVAGFEAQQAQFFAAMRARGVRLMTSIDLLPQLETNRAD